MFKIVDKKRNFIVDIRKSLTKQCKNLNRNKISERVQ